MNEKNLPSVETAATALALLVKAARQRRRYPRIGDLDPWRARLSRSRTVICRKSDPNGRKSAPYSQSATINCWRPQLVADGRQLKKVSNKHALAEPMRHARQCHPAAPGLVGVARPQRLHLEYWAQRADGDRSANSAGTTTTGGDTVRA